MEMRKKRRQIADPNDIDRILQECTICRVAFCKDNQPYVVPMNYGYEKNVIYCHTGHLGLKMDFLKANSRVCVEVDRNVQVQLRNPPCKSTCAYESIVAFGTGEIVVKESERVHGLDVIMRHLGADKFHPLQYDPGSLARTAILRIVLTSVTGRRSMD